MIDHWSMKGFEETRIYLLRYSEYSCRCGRVEEIRRGGTKKREREWYGARGTQPQPTQLAFQSSPLKPGSHATLKYQRQPAFQAAVERVDRIPSVSGTTILLHFPRDSAFLSLHPLRIFMADQPAPPDMRGRRRGGGC